MAINALQHQAFPLDSNTLKDTCSGWKMKKTCLENSGY